jgi:predicted dehydrogenase
MFLGGASALAMAAPDKSPNDKIQVGVIGCGARSHELQKSLYEVGGAEIVACVDAYDGRMERTQERWGKQVKRAADYREILADKSVDGVLVVTPDHWHKTMVVDAVRAGKDVYCEKPLTYKSSEGLEAIRAANDTRRMVQVGSQVVSTASQQEARRMIQAGKLGKVTMIRASYNRNSASGAWIYPIPPDASSKTVNWDMFLGAAPKRPFSLERFFRWRCFSDYSGGIATDLFVHLCTGIHYMMNAKVPSRVVALGQLLRWKDGRDVPDTINAILEYPEGFAVNLSCTFNNQTAAEQSFQFLGTEGTLELGGGMMLYPETKVEDNRWIIDSWPTRLEEAYWRDPKVQQNELTPQKLQAYLRAKRRVGEAVKLAPGKDMNYVHMKAWLDSIRTRQPHWEDAGVGHRAAACAHMVNASIREKRPVEWDFARDDVKG